MYFPLDDTHILLHTLTWDGAVTTSTIFFPAWSQQGFYPEYKSVAVLEDKIGRTNADTTYDNN